MSAIFVGGAVRTEVLRLLARDPGRLFNSVTMRHVSISLDYRQDPELSAAANQGADAVFGLVDRAHSAGGETVHRPDPIRQEVMAAIAQKLASIRTRKPVLDDRNTLTPSR